MIYKCQICRKYQTRYKSHLEKHLKGKETNSYKNDVNKLDQIKKQLYSMYPNKYKKPEGNYEIQLASQSEDLDQPVTKRDLIDYMNFLKENGQPTNHLQIDTQNNNIDNSQTNIMANHANIDNSVNYNNKKVDINCFGHPDLSMLTHDKMSEYMDDIPDSFANMFRDIYFNPAYRGNHIYYLSNKGSNSVNVISEKGIVTKTPSEISNHFIERQGRLYMMLFLDQEIEHNRLDENKFDVIDSKLYDDSQRVLGPIKQQIHNSLVENREMAKDIFDQYREYKKELEQDLDLAQAQTQNKMAITDQSVDDKPKLVIKPKRELPGLDQTYNKKLEGYKH